MKGILFIVYKEWVEFKNNRRLLFQIILQSSLYGSVFPLISWLIIKGVLPIDVQGFEYAKLTFKIYHVNFYPQLLFFLMSAVSSLFTLHSFTSEVEYRTIETLYSFPITWTQTVMGKFVFYMTLSLLCSYLISSIYWIFTFFIEPGLRVNYLLSYFCLLVPGISLYTVIASIFVSAKTRNTKVAYAYTGILTWGLFLAFFFLSWALRFNFNNKFIWILSIFLVVASAKIFYFVLKMNPEKLLVM